MPRLGFSSLRVRLSLLVLLAAFRTIGMMLYTNLEQRRRSAQDGTLKAARMVRLVAGVQRHLIEEVQRFLIDLAELPEILDDLGLLPALRCHFDRYTGQTGVHVSFEHSGQETRLPSELETAAYRIVQEALTNVAGHANVQEVTLRLWADPRTLDVQVKDRGTGFDFETALGAHVSSGLGGMRERAMLPGGELKVESFPGKGTRVRAEFPLTRSPEHSGKG